MHLASALNFRSKRFPVLRGAGTGLEDFRGPRVLLLQYEGNPTARFQKGSGYYVVRDLSPAQCVQGLRTPHLATSS